MRRRAFTLIEVLVVLSMVGLVLTTAFLVFRMGSRGFQRAVNKTGTLGELHRVTRAFQRDIKLTHFYSAAAHNRTVSVSQGTVDRDGLAIAGLSDWRDPDRFEGGTGLPKWDRWVLFYATREESGRLVRLEIARNRPSPGNWYPLKPFSNLPALMVQKPVELEPALRVGVLSQSVRAFSVELEPSRRLVKLELKLADQGGKRMTSEQKVEGVLETDFEISPMNSYPEL